MSIIIQQTVGLKWGDRKKERRKKNEILAKNANVTNNSGEMNDTSSVDEGKLGDKEDKTKES